MPPAVPPCHRRLPPEAAPGGPPSSSAPAAMPSPPPTSCGRDSESHLLWLTKPFYRFQPMRLCSSTVAIILGAYDWTKSGLPSAPSFRRSAHDFHRYLVTESPYGLGLQPDLVINLFNDPSP